MTTGQRSATRERELVCWERVRELEAELADLRAYHHRASDADFQLELREAAEARAEKAETLAQRYSDELDAKCEEVRELHTRHSECQARVAEWKLRAERAEAMLDENYGSQGWHHEKDVEAREREAD